MHCCSFQPRPSLTTLRKRQNNTLWKSRSPNGTRIQAMMVKLKRTPRFEGSR